MMGQSVPFALMITALKQWRYKKVAKREFPLGLEERTWDVKASIFANMKGREGAKTKEEMKQFLKGKRRYWTTT